MTINERINKAIENFDEKTDSIDKIIAVAYFIGREEGAKFLIDKQNMKALFAGDETEI